MMSRLLCAFALIFATIGSAQGATGPWIDVAPGAKIRLLTADMVGPDGKMLAGLEFELRNGMKTYWRVPGESGIPLTSDWQESRGIENVEFLWPMPTRELEKGYFDYVYKEDFVLPFEVQIAGPNADQSPHLVGELLMGICGEICVPVTFKIDEYLTLDQKDVAVSFKLDAARAFVPIEDERTDAPYEAVYLDVAENQLVIPASADQQENDTLILDLPNQSLLFDVPQNRPGLPLLTVKPLKDISLADHVGSTARLTYSGRAGAFEKMVPVLSIDALDQ